MPIISISSQPASNSTFAAYRPIVFKVIATSTDGSSIPPVVYCDVYINGIFYRTQSKTQYLSDNGGNSTWQFDIQDSCQEVLGKFLPDNGDSNITKPSNVIKTVYCKFRSSGIDIDGFIQPEGTIPIQGTSKTPATSGTGTQSNSLWIINAVLQHESNQDLLTHLNYFKSGTWDANSYPLTERGVYKICKQDSDSFAILSQKQPVCIVLNYKLKNDSTVYTATHCPTTCTGVSVGFYDLGSAINGTPYNVTIPLFGDAPFSIDSQTGLPGGVIATISGSDLIISGTPTEDSDLSGVHIIVSNCSGSSTVDVHGTTPCIGVTVSSESLPDAEVDQPYSGSINLSGTLPIGMTVLDLPAGLTATNLGGGSISITGTPTTEETGSGISLRFTNCDGSVDVNRNIDVVVPIPPPDGNGTIHNGITTGAEVEDVFYSGGAFFTPYTGVPVVGGADGTFSMPYEDTGNIAVRFNGGAQPSSITMEIKINGSTMESDGHTAAIVITSTNAYTIHPGDTIQINLF